MLTSSARSGDLLTGYFFGFELTPRLFGSKLWDLKFFLETHALILWIVWDALFAMAQYTVHGDIRCGRCAHC